MNRSNYSEDCDGWQLIRWRGAVESAIRGKRGQEFLKELLAALDAMPEKKLVREELVTPSGEVCALGSVMVRRGLDARLFAPDDSKTIADVLGIADALVREIEYINDDCVWGADTSDARRWEIVRGWVARQIKESAA